MRRAPRSIAPPIVLASFTVALSIALLVGWTLLVVRNLSVTREVTPNTWLLFAGFFAFVVIMTVLALLCVFLVREILEARRQDRFVDSVTHELRSPLASLKLCLETQAREGLSEDRRDALRQMMLADVDRLSAFIDDVLEASRIAHGRRTHEVADVPLGDLAARCALSVTRRHGVPKGSIQLDVPPELHVRTDRTALEVVLRNLMDNAVKYSGEPVHVHVVAEAVGAGAVRVEVRDNGIGIPSKYLDRVFDRFFRVPSEAVRVRRGTGLGLFVVSALVRDLGARIEAHSEGADRGAMFEVHFPGPGPETAKAA